MEELMEEPRPAARRPHLTPALVVAILALVVALGGTGYAALAIPKGAVGTAQLRNRAVTAPKIVPGAGVSLVYTRASTNVTVAPNSVGGGFALCPTGTHPIGGGAGTNDVPGMTVTESLPFSSATNSYSGAADSWSVYVQNTGTEPQEVDVYAVCITAASATATY
jgi:hypothetical protein